MAQDTHGIVDRGGRDRAEAADGAQSSLDTLRWWALVVVLVAGFMDLLDVTIVNVAIPTILKDLHAAYAQIEWIVAGYVLGFAGVLITGGRLGDIYGRKRMFLIGVAGFTVASALCGLATSPAMLIGSRIFEGAMAGLMVPQILAIIHVSFRGPEHAKAIGAFGGVMGSASALGLLIGGLLLRWNVAGLHWRPIFLVNVPVGLAALVAAWFVVRESRSPTAPRLDLIGMMLAISGVLMLVYPLTEGRSLHWPAWIFALMGCSVPVLALFVGYERRRTRTVGSPLMVLDLFRTRAFTLGLAVWLIFWIALGGFFLVWTLYMQVGLGWTPLRAGLTAATFAAGAAAGAGTSVQVLTPRFGRPVLMVGALLNAAGFAAYAWTASHYGPAIHQWQMIVPLVVAGLGFGLFVAPMVDLVLSGVPRQDAGSASGILNAIQQTAMALGVALVGVLFFAVLASNSGRGVSAVTPSLNHQLSAVGVPAPMEGRIDAGFRACVHDRSAATDPTKAPASCRLISASPVTARLGPVLTRAGLRANAHNFARTFGVILWYAAAFMIAVFAGLFALPRQVSVSAFEIGAGDPDMQTNP